MVESMSVKSTLELELRQLLDDVPSFRISTFPVFLDLIWDEDMSDSEYSGLDAAVVVDAPTGFRRAVFQRVRNEIRYYLTTNSSPQGEHKSDVGTVDVPEQAVALCREFLVDMVEPGDLVSPRVSLRFR